MLRWSQPQRALLAETLRDVANIAAGAMVFGQFLSDRAFSRGLAVLGVVVWGCLVAFALTVAGREDVMTGLVILLVGITVIGGVLTLIDGIAYRRERKSGKQ